MGDEGKTLEDMYHSITGPIFKLRDEHFTPPPHVLVKKNHLSCEAIGKLDQMLKAPKEREFAQIAAAFKQISRRDKRRAIWSRVRSGAWKALRPMQKPMSQGALCAKDKHGVTQPASKRSEIFREKLEGAYGPQRIQP